MLWSFIKSGFYKAHLNVTWPSAQTGCEDRLVCCVAAAVLLESGRKEKLN